MAFECGELLAGVGIPQPDRPVVAAASEQLALVDGDRAQRPDPVGDHIDAGELLAGVGIPEPDRPVVAAASEQLATVDGDRAQRIDPVLVAVECGELLAGVGVQSLTVWSLLPLAGSWRPLTVTAHSA